MPQLSVFRGSVSVKVPEWISDALGLHVPFLNDPVRGLAPRQASWAL